MSKLLKDWTLFEKVWLVTATLVILGLGLWWDDTWLGLASSISGILCVVLVAKGKFANFYFGIFQAITYGYIAWGYGLKGEAMLNIGFFLPIQFVAMWQWMKHAKKSQDAINGEEIYARRLTGKQWAYLIPVLAVACVVYAVLLNYINAQQVRLDSAAVVLSVAAQILMVKRFAEQWVLWIVINVLTVTLWVITLIQSGGNDWTILAMWVAFLANSIYGWLNWKKIAKGADNIA